MTERWRPKGWPPGPSDDVLPEVRGPLGRLWLWLTCRHPEIIAFANVHGVDERGRVFTFDPGQPPNFCCVCGKRLR